MIQADAELEVSIKANFVETSPYWYGIWQSRLFSKNQAEVVHRLFSRMLENMNALAERPVDSEDIELFLNAVARCIESNLNMHVELVPRGFSDGLTWATDSHCPDCTAPMQLELRKCNACGYRGKPIEGQKRKVLGLRPYIQLDEVIGPEKTNEIVNQLKQRRGSQG